MSKEMVIAAVLGRLPLVLRASATCGEYSGPLPAEFFPSVGIGTSSNRRYGAFNLSRLSAWPAPLRTMSFVQKLEVHTLSGFNRIQYGSIVGVAPALPRSEKPGRLARFPFIQTVSLNVSIAIPCKQAVPQGSVPSSPVWAINT